MIQVTVKIPNLATLLKVFLLLLLSPSLNESYLPTCFPECTVFLFRPTIFCHGLNRVYCYWFAWGDLLLKSISARLGMEICSSNVGCQLCAILHVKKAFTCRRAWWKSTHCAASMNGRGATVFFFFLKTVCHN